MSSSPLSRTLATSGCRDIPSRRIDSGDLPADYCSTPGGTIFSTTPGGTRIIYDRQFLLQMRNSPIAKTPPKNLPNIPGVTSPAKTAIATGAGTTTPVVTVVPPPPPPAAPIEPPKENGDVLQVKAAHKEKHESGDEAQFEMDI